MVACYYCLVVLVGPRENGEGRDILVAGDDLLLLGDEVPESVVGVRARGLVVKHALVLPILLVI